MKGYPAVLFTALLFLFAAFGCGSNRPLPPSSLAREADSYLKRFDEDFAMARYGLARQDAERAFEIYNALDRKREKALSLNNLGAVQERLGDRAGAEGSYREAAETARKANADRILVAALNNLSGMLVDQQPEMSRELAEEALALSLKGGWNGSRARALYSLAEADNAAGNSEGAADRCLEALELSRAVQEKGIESACLTLQGRIEASKGNFPGAIGHLESALEMDRRREDPFAIARDYEIMAQIRENDGDSEGAQSDRARAAQIYRFLGLSFKSTEP